MKWDLRTGVKKMNKLEQLINERCPNGVDYKKIKYVFKRVKGTPITASKMKEISDTDGEITIVAGGKNIITAKEENIPNANIIRQPAVLVQSRGIIDVVYFENPFTFKNEMWAYTIEEKATVKYLYYVLKNNIKYFRKLAFSMGALPQISLTATEEFEIPFPPLAVQEEIVRILDKFEKLNEKLNEKLAEELVARKQQYEFYRDLLLTYDGNIEIELGEVAIVTKLAGFEFTNYVRYSDNGKIIALRGLNVKNGHIDLHNVKYIDNSDLSKLERSKLQIGDMIFTYVGTIGQVALIDENDRFYLAPNVALIRVTDNKLEPEFMCYYFQSSQFYQKQLTRLLQSSSMKNIPMEKIRKFKIPVPSNKQQTDVIEILNRFNKLYNDISERLLTEMEARQKQYEYYRDKLLTFKKKEAPEHE